MDTNEKYTFKTRADIESIKKKRDRINMKYVLLGVGTMVLGLCINATTDFIWGVTPLTSWMESKYRWDGWIISSVVVVVLLSFYDKTKMRKRERAEYRAALVADAFTKTEWLLNYGINIGSVKRVRKGLEKLEAVSDSFTEMEEYRELVASGRAWLREHDRKG